MGLLRKINRREVVVLSLITLLGAGLRLSQVDYPLDNPDVGRDLLISRHIAYFNEHTALGPANPLLGVFKNSPLYYYLLAAIIRIHDSFIWVSVVNLILQISIIPMVYLTGKRMFNGRVGLIAAGVLAFNPLAISEAAYFWQPNLMSWFINLSLLTFVFAVIKKNLALLVISAVFLATAGAVNNSALVLIPAFLLINFLLFGKSLKFYLSSLTLIITLTAYFLPNLVYWSSRSGISLEFSHKIAPDQALLNLWDNLGTFTSEWWSLGSFASLSFSLLTIGFTIWLIRKKTQDRSNISLIVLVIVSFFILSSPFHLPWRPDYFTPIFTPMSLLITALLIHVPNRLLRVALLGLLLVFPLLKFPFQPPLQNLTKILSATRAIEYKVLAISKTAHPTDLDFFRIVYYPGKLDGKVVLSYDAVFWYQIEKDFGNRMSYLINSDFGYRSLNTNEFLILGCREISNEECLGQLINGQSLHQAEFLIGRGNFQEVELFYHQNGFNFYLFKRS